MELLILCTVFSPFVISFLFEKYACKYRTDFGFCFLGFYLQANITRNDVTSWIVKMPISRLESNCEWTMSAYLEKKFKSSVDICWLISNEISIGDARSLRIKNSMFLSLSRFICLKERSIFEEKKLITFFGGRGGVRTLGHAFFSTN